MRVPTTRAQTQLWLTTKPPPTPPPHISASTPWPLVPSGRACTGDNDTMHPCHAHMHNEHELQHTPAYAGIPMPLLKYAHTYTGTTYIMNSAHPGPVAAKCLGTLPRYSAACMKAFLEARCPNPQGALGIFVHPFRFKKRQDIQKCQETPCDQ